MAEESVIISISSAMVSDQIDRKEVLDVTSKTSNDGLHLNLYIFDIRWVTLMAEQSAKTERSDKKSIDRHCKSVVSTV